VRLANKPEFIAQVFERFVQPFMTRANKGGDGAGAFHCSHLVDMSWWFNEVIASALKVGWDVKEKGGDHLVTLSICRSRQFKPGGTNPGGRSDNSENTAKMPFDFDGFDLKESECLRLSSADHGAGTTR